MARALTALLLAFALSCLAPLPASSDTALRQLTLRQQMLGWEGVGRCAGWGGWQEGQALGRGVVCLSSRAAAPEWWTYQGRRFLYHAWQVVTRR